MTSQVTSTALITDFFAQKNNFYIFINNHGFEICLIMVRNFLFVVLPLLEMIKGRQVLNTQIFNCRTLNEQIF